MLRDTATCLEALDAVTRQQLRLLIKRLGPAVDGLLRNAAC